MGLKITELSAMVTIVLEVMKADRSIDSTMAVSMWSCREIHGQWVEGRRRVERTQVFVVKNLRI